MEKHELVAELFSKIPFEDYSASKLVVACRNARQLDKSKQIFKRAGIAEHTTLVRELDYVKFHKQFAKCDIVVPMIDHLDTPLCFDSPVGLKKSSGITPAIIAYKRPAVVHEVFAALYRDYFSAPIEVYNDNNNNAKINSYTIKKLNRKIKV